MRDKVSIARVALLHPADRQKYTEAIDAAEARFNERVAIRVVQGLRTFPEQDGLYKIGRTVKGEDVSPKRPMGRVVTNSRGGQSYHNYGLAIDFAILYDLDGNGSYESLSWDLLKDFDKDGEADWQEVVDEFESRRFSWGGRWNSIKDDPHFEFTHGHHWRDLMESYNAGKFIPGTNYVAL